MPLLAPRGVCVAPLWAADSVAGPLLAGLNISSGASPRPKLVPLPSLAGEEEPPAPLTTNEGGEWFLIPAVLLPAPGEEC